MLICENYKMFRGAMRISPVSYPPFTKCGTWLYKPEYNCWYCGGSSFPAEICEVWEDETE